VGGVKGGVGSEREQSVKKRGREAGPSRWRKAGEIKGKNYNIA